jgi:alcohol dehydrogenase (cytochrome c)
VAVLLLDILGSNGFKGYPPLTLTNEEDGASVNTRAWKSWRSASVMACTAASLVWLAPASVQAAAETAQAVGNVAPSAVDFPTPGYDLQETRDVATGQINVNNVGQLQLVKVVHLADLASPQSVGVGEEDFPIEVDGRLYVTTGTDMVFALDAATGALLWRWTPPSQYLNTNSDVVPANRGVAYGDGKVFLLTSGDWLVAIDAKTGKTVNATPLAAAVPGVTPANGYYETTAPVYWNGRVYVGSSGGDNGVRGFVMAYWGDTLKPAWPQPFWTIPDEAGYGGGTVWSPVAVNPVAGLVYAATGNPAPDFYGAGRPGANPYTDGVVALDAYTGQLRWFGQENAHDVLDYDAASPPMVVQARVDGQRRQLVVEGGKDGKWFAWDAITGEPVYDGIPFVKVQNSPPTPQGTLEYPGTLGGENYAPEAFDRTQHLALVPGINAPNYVCASTNGTTYTTQNCPVGAGATDFGTAIGYPVGTPTGNVTAIDVDTGQIVYQFDTPNPMRGGITATEGGVAFYGGLGGHLTAFATATGQILASVPASGPIAAPPAVYTVHGREYVVVVTGGTVTSPPFLGPDVDLFALPSPPAGAEAEQGN